MGGELLAGLVALALLVALVGLPWALGAALAALQRKGDRQW